MCMHKASMLVDQFTQHEQNLLIFSDISLHITFMKQALTKAYSPHDLRSVGISNKSEFNTVKMGQFTLF